MPYADKDKQREFARKWRAARRDEWLANNGPCRRCWSNDNLRVYYPDQSEKVEHRIWTWKKSRREEELKKCVILCFDCWFAVRNYLYTRHRQHGTELMYDKGRCRCQLCRDAHAANRRYYRGDKGRKMSTMAAALKELSSIRDRIYIEIDQLSKEIEQKQAKILDIDTAVRVLQSLDGTHTLVGEALEYVPDPPRAEDSADASAEIPPTIPPESTPNLPKRRRRHPKQTPIFLSPKNDVKIEPLASSGSVLGSEFMCLKCRTKFMSQAALNAHNEERHTRQDLENRCPVTGCRKNFGTQTDMENHVIHHHPKYAAEYGYA